VTSVEQIAARDKCSIRQVNKTISLAFLAPDLVKAAVKSTLQTEVPLLAFSRRSCRSRETAS
jgi:hypothetical protein